MATSIHLCHKTILTQSSALATGVHSIVLYPPSVATQIDAEGEITIYGYNPASFPPTNFHTATQVADALYIIGNVGYESGRQYKETPVYKLDLGDFKITKLETSGVLPGWIAKHKTYVRSLTDENGNIKK